MNDKENNQVNDSGQEDESAAQLYERLKECTDGTVWADEFNAVMQRKLGIRLDRDWLVAWFANALMIGFDRGVATEQKLRQEQIKPILHIFSGH